MAKRLASSGLTLALAGMGISPQTPLPPLMILLANKSTALGFLAYLAATSLKDGPRILVFTA